LHSKKPILAMIPPVSEAFEILAENGQNFICSMEDIESIEENLMAVYKDLKNRKIDNYKDAAVYSREIQTRQFVDFLSDKI